MTPRSREPSEFDNGPEPGQEEAQVIANGRRTPADFFAEEVAFASDLQDLFQLEREEFPPLFFQTVNSLQSCSLERRELEQSVAVHVFERLDLPFSPPGAPGAAPRPPQRLRVLPRVPRRLGLSAVFAVVVLCLVAVAPLLAQGVSGLLSQPEPPGSSGAHFAQILDIGATQYLSLNEVKQVLPFDVYWLGQAPSAYRFQSLRLRLDQDWTSGPLVESQYGVVQPADGASRLIIREFRPAPGSTVLLLADQRAIHSLFIAGSPAVYIDGQWVRHYEQNLWAFGTQAELVYQEHGLIFWLTVEQPAGMTPQALAALAQSLEKLSLEPPRPHLPEMQPIPLVQLAAPLGRPALGNVESLIPAGTPASAGSLVYIALGQPPDD